VNEFEREELLAVGRWHFERGDVAETVLLLVALLANDLHAADISITHRGMVSISHHVEPDGGPAFGIRE
jgi:hypothetical protein